MTSFLTSLHRFPVARAVELGAAVATASGWRREYAGLLYRVSERIVPPLPRPLRAAAAGFWVAFLSGDRNFAFRPALVHRDLAREHIRHAADGGAITGVLDWEDASIGDPAIDFAGLDRDLGPRFADEVLAHYGGHVDGAFRGRRAFYAALGPYHEVLFGLDTESRIHVLRVLGSLRRALRSAPCLSSIGDAWTLEWTVRLGCGATSSSVAPWLPVQCAAPAHPLDPGRALRALAGRSGSAGIAVAGPPGRIRSMFAL
jgi:aminoglycoside phosphotransferase (APT) family kinase protein